MTARPGIPLAAAVADLRAAGLLQDLLVGGPDGLRPAAVAPAAAAFAGAGLDSRRLGAGELFVALRGEKADGRDFAVRAAHAGHWVLTRVWDGPGADPLPGAPAPDTAGVLVSCDPEAALAALAAAHRARLDGLIVVGVTGTNGKTTTKDFVRAALSGAGAVAATSGNLNNRLGVPLTLLDLHAGLRFAVVEMGASAVGDIERLAGPARPRVGIITNASPAHLAEFGSLDGIIQGKGELLDALPNDGTAVLNADSPGFERWCARARCRVESLGRRVGDHRWTWQAGSPGQPSVLTLDGREWPVPLPGEHNAANLAAAVLAAGAAGASVAEIAAGLAGFQGSPHRAVLLRLGGRVVLDDSYNANPGSMAAAARALVALPGAGRPVAVLGAMAELGPDSHRIHLETGQILAAAGVAALVAVGENARGLREGFDAAGGSGHYCASLEEAAVLLTEITAPGDRLLVKGSRSAGMERLLALLEAAWA
ncbi:MAG: UDP-N-acetylmuramoyl-tripeptide--D-alanyl-D-alanine ligase [bacterium]|nr:UDP-N-acetylmuramoyl-tripeptide--D-alanyl-D-alanine ligase [bacterium]